MNRPRLAEDVQASHGIAALALLAVLAAVVLTAEFPAVAGFDAGITVTEGIGYALLGLGEQSSGLVTESFLVSFVLIAIVLDAALDGAVMLARRDDELADATDSGGET